MKDRLGPWYIRDMDADTKRTYEILGYVMGLLIMEGYRPHFDWLMTEEDPTLPGIRIAGVRYSEKTKEKISSILQAAGFTKTRFHVRPGGSPNVRFHTNPETGDEVAIEWDGSGDMPHWMCITAEQ